MSIQLPPNPSLKQLKNRAKDLRKAHQSAAPQAAERIKEHLPRLGKASTEEILAGDLSLQEAQHVIACECGFKNWNWLQAVVEVDFELIGKLTDREVQTLLRETSQLDLTVGLIGAGEELRERLLSGMTERVRAFIESEIEILRNRRAGEVEEVRRRILLQAAILAGDGKLEWPNGDRAVRREPLPQPELQPSTRLIELVQKELEELNADELEELCAELSEQVHRAGVQSLDGLVDAVQSPFLAEGLKLAADGTEPDLSRDILETRMEQAILPGQLKRGQMAGDNPGVIGHKLSAFYIDYQGDPPADGYQGETRQPTAPELTTRLRENPPGKLSFEKLADLFIDIGFLARYERLSGLAPLTDGLEKTSDPASALMRRGLEMAAANADPNQVMEALEGQLEEEMKESRARHRMIIAGIETAGKGMKPDEVAEAVRNEAL